MVPGRSFALLSTKRKGLEGLHQFERSDRTVEATALVPKLAFARPLQNASVRLDCRKAMRFCRKSRATVQLTPPPNLPKPSWAREPGPFEDLWIAPLVGITVLIWIRLLMAAIGVMPLF